jgi:hypothetical protein
MLSSRLRYGRRDEGRPFPPPSSFLVTMARPNKTLSPSIRASEARSGYIASLSGGPMTAVVHYLTRQYCLTAECIRKEDGNYEATLSRRTPGLV